jgi:hypothetical protein
MVSVLDTNDNFALASAGTALSEVGIIYDVVPIADVPASLKAREPKWWIRPCRILVAEEDAQEARSLIDPFQEPIPGDFNTESGPNQP